MTKSEFKEWYRQRMKNYKVPADTEYCKKCTSITKSGKEITSCIAEKDEHCPNTWKLAIYAPGGY